MKMKMKKIKKVISKLYCGPYIYLQERGTGLDVNEP